MKRSSQQETKRRKDKKMTKQYGTRDTIAVATEGRTRKEYVEFVKEFQNPEIPITVFWGTYKPNRCPLNIMDADDLLKVDKRRMPKMAAAHDGKIVVVF